MPKAYYPQPYRPIYTHKHPRSRPSFIYSVMLFTLAGFVILVTLGLCLFTWLINATRQSEQPPPVPTEFVPAPGSYAVLGKPSIDVAMINQVLAYYQSPAKGKGKILYEYGLKYHIDPAYALAFFMHESTFGTEGVAKVTRSLGNIRATPGYPEYKGYRKYNSWEEGFEDWYRLIANVYVDQWKLYTIDQIIPVYAPSSDNNNEDAYIRAVKLAITKWHRGIVEI